MLMSCRLVAEAAQAGSVIGKGGRVVQMTKKNTGCKIRVLTDDLPLCASSSDEIIEVPRLVRMHSNEMDGDPFSCFFALFNFLRFQAEPPTIVVATIGSLCQMLERHIFSLETVRVLIVDEGSGLFA
ncbi:uncharacterized protein LOC106761301 isoform X1 [Vigna radiata var. radiata]|uniref:Uncharacterized protein LOC106761301 isoform X1 n=1 Tax=Vigna radiata var. radiata TaxID=3916 RepID=A0A3Q0F2V4_VIGRR|nr:uncharacterized protein LOC106761301 isoform X1 [Vigna radiata var. radiata]XP_022636945.1 uncharacterized protein LOC106761301 isoform X1 [Vigna radiata var. radiata]